MTFAEKLAGGSIAYQRCPGCGASVFPQRVRCHRCQTGDLEWRASSGSGVIYSVTMIPQRDRDPRWIALVDMDEGFRLMGSITAGEPPAIGDVVQLDERRTSVSQPPAAWFQAVGT